MKERPILFSSEMVRALLSGRKTQTRRVVKWANEEHSLVRLKDRYAAPVRDGVGLTWIPYGGSPEVPMPPEKISELSPYGAIGDRLWVRETWDVGFTSDEQWVRFRVDDTCSPVEYEHRNSLIDNWDNYHTPGWRPSIHMPRWASRLTLELTDVRVERVQAITNSDAIAEGCVGGATVEGYSEDNPADPYEEYAILWDALNAKRGYSWDSNPWVWVLSFRRLDA